MREGCGHSGVATVGCVPRRAVARALLAHPRGACMWCSCCLAWAGFVVCGRPERDTVWRELNSHLYCSGKYHLRSGYDRSLEGMVWARK